MVQGFAYKNFIRYIYPMISYDGFNIDGDLYRVEVIRIAPKGENVYRCIYMKFEDTSPLTLAPDEGEEIYAGKLCVLENGEKIPKHFQIGQDLFISRNKLHNVRRIFLARNKTMDAKAANITTAANKESLHHAVEANLLEWNRGAGEDVFKMTSQERSQVLRNCFGINEVAPSLVNRMLTCEKVEEFLLLCAGAGLDIGAPAIKNMFMFKFDWESIVKISQIEIQRLDSVITKIQ